MRIYILAILFYCIISNVLFCQVTKEEDIIPRSPEAANLGVYGSVDISEYTGKPNIDILFHNIRSGDLNYPLKLYYDATGVRVNQEASWVGLGWEISAIAGISYIPKGGNDQNIVDTGTDEEWETLIDYINPNKIHPSVNQENFNFSPVCSYNALESSRTPATVIGSASSGLGALDLYNVTLPDLSFKFYLDRYTGEPKFYGERNNCKIVSTSTGFLVIDGNGIKYYFQDQEGGEFLQEISNWYLSEIRHPDGDYLLFKYESFGTISVAPALIEKKNIQCKWRSI